jgi:hypothetical protein
MVEPKRQSDSEGKKKSGRQVNSHPSILGNMEEEEQPRIQE